MRSMSEYISKNLLCKLNHILSVLYSWLPGFWKSKSEPVTRNGIL